MSSAGRFSKTYCQLPASVRLALFWMRYSSTPLSPVSVTSMAAGRLISAGFSGSLRHSFTTPILPCGSLTTGVGAGVGVGVGVGSAVGTGVGVAPGSSDGVGVAGTVAVGTGVGVGVAFGSGVLSLKPLRVLVNAASESTPATTVTLCAGETVHGLAPCSSTV